MYLYNLEDFMGSVYWKYSELSAVDNCRRQCLCWKCKREPRKALGHNASRSSRGHGRSGEGSSCRGHKVNRGCLWRKSMVWSLPSLEGTRYSAGQGYGGACDTLPSVKFANSSYLYPTFVVFGNLKTTETS